MEKKAINNIVEGYICYIKHEDLPFDITDSILNSISYIDEIDKEITTQCNAPMIERVDYYEFIYRRNAFEKLIETYKDKVSWVNCFIYEAINIDFFKIIMYLEIIDVIDEQIKLMSEDEKHIVDNLVDNYYMFVSLKKIAEERKKECINSINNFKGKSLDYNTDERGENDITKEDIEKFVSDNIHIIS